MDHNDDSKLGRRQAMQVLGLGLTAAGFLIADPASAAEPAAKKPDAAPAGGSCKDKAPIDAASKQLRSALQYKEKSDAPDKKCITCAQYEAKKYGDCGACKLFTGAVNPEGACLSYAPLAKP